MSDVIEAKFEEEDWILVAKQVCLMRVVFREGARFSQVLSNFCP